ncbi:MAG: hypothetical protein D6805_03195 [Planctomycetota bacterium]|nr:MAG: hypothetical protein D6805_03195 [Planctomycetota bacterium]
MLKNFRTKILFAQGLCVLLMLFTVVAAFGYVQLYNGYNFVRWNLASSTTVDYTIHSAGSDDIPDKSEEVAIRLAFQAWNNVSSAQIQFQEDPTYSQVSDISAKKSDGTTPIHLVIFDENNATGLFSPGSTIVALTPVLSNSNGEILDADIVFNGRDHNFSTDGKANTFDVQSIATHEIGHFLGLDHSANRTATMYPFSRPNEYHLRSLSLDDVAGVNALYPATTLESSTGQVVSADTGAAINGAHVVAVSSNGEVLAATLTDANGNFTLNGVSGDYYVYAEPLDGPVTQSNINRQNIDTNFSTTFYGGNANPTIFRGGKALGILQVPAAGTLNLLEAIQANTNRALLLYQNSTQTIWFHATGFDPSTGQLKFSHSGITLQSAIKDLPGNPDWYQASISVDASVPPGSYNLWVQMGNAISILTGGLEVLPPAPSISALSPNEGGISGNTTVLIQGANFQNGANVLFDDTLLTQVTYLNSSTLQVQTPPGTLGQKVRVMVINPDGQFTALADAFTYVPDPPAVDSYSPNEGATAGGTTVTIKGSNFQSGITVTFGGQNATIVSATSTQIVCTAPPNANPGFVDIVLTNPNGRSATITNGFNYLLPVITNIMPTVGYNGGGTTVLIQGKGFDPRTPVVRFGNKTATNVQLLDEQNLTCVSPSGETGEVDITIENSDNKFHTLANAFRYTTTPDPKITSVQPNTGYTLGGDLITITGENFDDQAKVYFGGNLGEIVSIDPTQIQVKTPAGSEGKVDIIVENSTFQKAFVLNGFTYIVFVPQSSGGGKKGGGGCTLQRVPPSAEHALGSLFPLLLLGLTLTFLRRKRK